MISITSLGIIISLVILIIYIFYVFLKNYVLAGDVPSLLETEVLHRMYLVSGGGIMTIGLIGISENIFAILRISNPIDRSEALNFNLEGFLISFLLFFFGLFVISVGNATLKSQLWKPLEDISEFSAEFGRNFTASRLPIIGGKELRRFSERFNENISNLSNSLSETEILISRIKDKLDVALTPNQDLSLKIKELSKNLDSYKNVSAKQINNINLITDEVNQFIEWYTQNQDSLDEQLKELSSIADLGNLISVNAAIESVNMKVENPGFTTLADKLHDLAKSLEERQEQLQRLIVEVKNNYTDFSEDVTRTLSDVNDNTKKAFNLNNSINELLLIINRYEKSSLAKSEDLSDLLDKIKDTLPRSY